MYIQVKEKKIMYEYEIVEIKPGIVTFVKTKK